MIFETEKIRTIIIEDGLASLKNMFYIVYDKGSKEGVLIDPAWNRDVILGNIRKHDIKIKHILLTHHHDDHINLANSLSHELHVQVWISHVEYTYYIPALDNVNLILNESSLSIGLVNCIPVFTPGHTKGGVCFLIDDHVFTGDTLFSEGCGSCNGPGGDPKEMFYSIQKLKKILPSETRVFSGHSYGMKPGKFFEEICKSNIYLNIASLEVFIRFRMRNTA